MAYILPKKRWENKGYSNEIEKSIEYRKLNNIPDDKIIAKFSTLEECKKYARYESESNWYNYYPSDDTFKKQDPVQFTKNKIYKGKLAELVFAYKCKKHGYKIIEAPTVFSEISFPKYDLIVKDKNGIIHTCDIKCSEHFAKLHKEKYTDVEVVYVTSSTKDIELGHCKFKII